LKGNIGALSDHIGRKPIVISALILYFVSIYPLFSWMYANPSFKSLLITQVALCCLMGAFSGPNINSIGRTVSSTRTFDGARNRLQHGCHAIRRFRAVFRNLVDPDNRLAGGAGILCKVRQPGYSHLCY
jgi:MFS family permease